MGRQYRTPSISRCASDVPPNREDFAQYQRERSHSVLLDSRKRTRARDRASRTVPGGLETIDEEEYEAPDYTRTTSYMTGRWFDAGRNAVGAPWLAHSPLDPSPLGLFGKLPIELVQEIVEFLKDDIHVALPTINVQAPYRVVQRPTSLSNGCSLFGIASTIAATSKALRNEVTSYLFGSPCERHYLKITSRWTKGNKYNPHRVAIRSLSIPVNVKSLFIYIDVSYMQDLTLSSKYIKVHWDESGIYPLLTKALKHANIQHLIVRIRLHHRDIREYDYPFDKEETFPVGDLQGSVEDVCVTLRRDRAENAYMMAKHVSQIHSSADKTLLAGHLSPQKLISLQLSRKKNVKQKWNMFRGTLEGYGITNEGMKARIKQWFLENKVSKELQDLWSAGNMMPFPVQRWH